MTDDAVSLDEQCPKVIEFERDFPAGLSADEIARLAKDWKRKHLKDCSRCQAFAIKRAKTV